MARDSLFGETILWSGSPRTVTVPTTYKVTAVVLAIISAVTLSYAVVAAMALHVPIGGMLLASAWCAAFAVGAWRIPLWWRSEVEYLVTDKHVIWRRGRLRRSMETRGISYALIRWNPNDSSTGDIVLVRAVPTGALRRTLRLTLTDVTAPDRLWAIVRGVRPSEPLGDGERPLAQRLDEGERVLWSAIPLASAWTARRAATAAVGAIVAFAFVDALIRAIPGFSKILSTHLLPASLFAVLVVGATLGLALMLAVAVGVGYHALVRPTRLARDALLRHQCARAHPARPRRAPPRSLAHRVRHRRSILAWRRRRAARHLPRPRRPPGARDGDERCVRRARGGRAPPRVYRHRRCRDGQRAPR